MLPTKAPLAALAALVLATSSIGAGTVAAQDAAGAEAAAPSVAPAEKPEAPAAPTGLQASIDAAFGAYVVDPIAGWLFWDIMFWDNGSETDAQLPIIVAWLVLGAIFFTLRMQFINLRGFRHAIDVTRGRYDHPDDPGEVSHFQALASALSATVGLGNIAGVAIAVATGGPGAVFWMVVAGFLGMSSKFTECTLGQVYRVVDTDGHVSGGPMRYLSAGLAELGMARFGRFLAFVFALLCVGGSFGGGNMFQSNQSFALVSNAVPALKSLGWLYGLAMAVLVGLVIIGGIKRIGSVAGYIVPLMCGIYVLAGLFILVVNAARVPEALGTIVGQAFNPEAQFGGLLGVLVTGFKRAAFSNEAGIGSASIAHSAAATDEPVREGIVALLEPFIDTIVVCTMTGLVVVVTGAYAGGHADGAAMTAAAFASVIPWFPNLLAVAVFFFAFSTMISWSYYGERCWTTLFGANSSLVYKVLFLFCTMMGPILQLGNVLTFSDLMILGMALPNITGLVLLAPKVKTLLDDYMLRLQSGKMPPVAAGTTPK
ncbi:MAG: alanine:cation symporter family protein [Myxococcales bacterium]|nr:alanine:cation symporter family protein [Myxococcales bacterium]